MNAFPNPNNTSSFRFSIVIPTYERRDMVISSVLAWEYQEFVGSFEVIVVVDGSTDGTAEALQSLDTPFPLTIIEQTNQGAAAARNRGSDAAKGEIILFLDDDMEAHPRLLVEHNLSYGSGADVVFGHIPLHPKLPANFLTEQVNSWTEERKHRLSTVNLQITPQDLLSGQISLYRESFLNLGGFDNSFTKEGSFGNEDIDFGYRLLQSGCKIVFNSNAISWHKYADTPYQNLQKFRQLGRADVVFIRKHPQLTDVIGNFGAESQCEKVFWRWLRYPLCWFVLALINLGFKNPLVANLFSKVRRLEYWQGVRDAGGIPCPRPLRVLCYHSTSDQADDPALRDFCIPAEQLRGHIQLLKHAGFNFINASECLHFVRGNGGLPFRPVLLTFDDGYQDTLDVALPILKDEDISAIAFVVSQRLGRTNDWDLPIGASQIKLLDAEGVQELVKGGVDIGSHSRTHIKLNRISVEDLSSEIGGAVMDLEAIGLGKPLFLAYPYGEYNEKVKAAAQEAGIQAAFTVERGLVQPQQDPYQLPRIEIFRRDVGWRFLAKVVLPSLVKLTPGRW